MPGRCHWCWDCKSQKDALPAESCRREDHILLDPHTAYRRRVRQLLDHLSKEAGPKYLAALQNVASGDDAALRSLRRDGDPSCRGAVTLILQDGAASHTVTWRAGCDTLHPQLPDESRALVDGLLQVLALLLDGSGKLQPGSESAAHNGSNGSARLDDGQMEEEDLHQRSGERCSASPSATSTGQPRPLRHSTARPASTSPSRSIAADTVSPSASFTPQRPSTHPGTSSPSSCTPQRPSTHHGTSSPPSFTPQRLFTNRPASGLGPSPTLGGAPSPAPSPGSATHPSPSSSSAASADRTGQEMHLESLCKTKDSPSFRKQRQDKLREIQEGRVTKLRGVSGKKQSQWVRDVLNAAAPNLTDLELLEAGWEHLKVVYTMPKLVRLDVGGNVQVSQTKDPPVLPDPPADRVGLQFLDAGYLPKETIVSLLQAHADTLSELNLWVGTAGRPGADAQGRWPKSCPDLPQILASCNLKALKQLHLLRDSRFIHNRKSCREQLDAIREALPRPPRPGPLRTHTRVSCELCRRQSVDSDRDDGACDDLNLSRCRARSGPF